MDLKEYKNILEEEYNNGISVDSKKIQEAKTKLLNSNENVDENSKLLFKMENHTIEYSLKILDEYLKEKENNIIKTNKLNEKNTSKKQLLYVANFVVVLIITLTAVYYVFLNM